MSVDIAWDQVTSGSDGEALAETIRSFIHAKFQQIALPRFISAVHVHSFEFGSVSPEIEIKDICDPLPDFYEDDEGEEDEELEQSEKSPIELVARNSSRAAADYGPTTTSSLNSTELHNRVAALHLQGGTSHASAPLSTLGPAASILRDQTCIPNDSHPGSFARSGTPGIPGGTSNMGYFHLPVGGLSGVQTPLAAVAGGPFATHAWLRDQQAQHASLLESRQGNLEFNAHQDKSSNRPRTAGSVSSPELGSPLYPSSPVRRPVGYLPTEKVSDDVSSDLLAAATPPSAEVGSPTDLQVVAHVVYSGDVRMTLTAEIMLDYPMPSFVKIPLKLSITSVSFDGVAILAYIRNKMHFCFLDPEDAETLVGSTFDNETVPPKPTGRKSTIKSLLREMQVETEIGRQENGKQVLKNVGKVEAFVLEQVRTIFEEEFVFPSFWTFLV